MDVESIPARLACYDALAAAARHKVGSAAPPAAATKPSSSEVASFGTPAARVVERDDGRQELHDKINALQRTPAGAWIVTLASGQVWRQTVPEHFNLTAGDEVRISPSKWGESYRLSSGSLRGFIQVERVK